MPTFIVQANYTQEAVKGLMSGAKNRGAVIAGLIEKAGGSMKALYMTSGKHDVLCIAEFDDASDGIAVNMAIGASGAASNFQTIRAWTPEEFEAIAGKAAAISGAYAPPG